jgi:hypothetical protein
MKKIIVTAILFTFLIILGCNSSSGNESNEQPELKYGLNETASIMIDSISVIANYIEDTQKFKVRFANNSQCDVISYDLEILLSNTQTLVSRDSINLAPLGFYEFEVDAVNESFDTWGIGVSLEKGDNVDKYGISEVATFEVDSVNVSVAYNSMTKVFQFNIFNHSSKYLSNLSSNIHLSNEDDLTITEPIMIGPGNMGNVTTLVYDEFFTWWTCNVSVEKTDEYIDPSHHLKDEIVLKEINGINVATFYSNESESFMISLNNQSDEVINKSTIKIGLSSGQTFTNLSFANFEGGEQGYLSIECSIDDFEWWTLDIDFETSQSVHNPQYQDGEEREFIIDDVKISIHGLHNIFIIEVDNQSENIVTKLDYSVTFSDNTLFFFDKNLSLQPGETNRDVCQNFNDNFDWWNVDIVVETVSPSFNY